MICKIINVSVRVTCLAFGSTLIIPHITKTSSNNCLVCRITKTKITPRASFTVLNKQMTQINTPERLAAKAFFGLLQSHNRLRSNTKPYNKSLIHLVCSVCTEKYCLRFLSHRKTSGNTFPYRPHTRLISPYYYTVVFFSAAANGSPFFWNWGENYAGSSGLPTKQLKTVQPQADVEVGNSKRFKDFIHLYFVYILY